VPNTNNPLGYTYLTKVVIIDFMGHTIDATFNPENYIQRLHVEVEHPVLGDFNIEQEFTNEDTIDVGNGVKWPIGWHSHQGYDDNYQFMHDTTGHNAFGGTLDEITVNGCQDYPIPASVADATFEENVTSEEIAPGVYLMGGDVANSVAIELADYIAVVEAPLDEDRTLAVAEAIVDLIPDKPIRFLFNTHQHFDHLGGMRAYMHLGVTTITHWRNADFYIRDVMVYDNGVAGFEDITSIAPPTELAEGYFIEGFRENYTLTDGEREVYATYVNPLDVEGMSMVFIPDEGILIQADLFNNHVDWENPTEAEVDAATALYNNVVQLGYDVETIVPIHGTPLTWAEFLEITGVDEED
jgi:glyoxylase-like metal-dependent hydrolase (beta-lactamase superfamily II)